MILGCHRHAMGATCKDGLRMCESKNKKTGTMRVEKKKFRTKVSRGFPNLHAKEQSFSALCERTEHEAAQEYVEGPAAVACSSADIAHCASYACSCSRPPGNAGDEYGCARDSGQEAQPRKWC